MHLRKCACPCQIHTACMHWSYIFQKVQLKFSSCSCALYNNHNLWSTTRQHRHNPRVKFLTSQCSLQLFITAEISQAFVLVRFFLSSLSWKNSSRSSQAGFGGRERDVYCGRRMAEQLWLYLETGIPTLGKFTIAKCELFSLVTGNKKRQKKKHAVQWHWYYDLIWLDVAWVLCIIILNSYFKLTFS